MIDHFLPVKKEKRAIAAVVHARQQDRAARGGAELVVLERRLLEAAAWGYLAAVDGVVVGSASLYTSISAWEAFGQVALRMQIDPHRILMQVNDTGPGIPDVQLALQAGWSTATQAVRDMGFGAGMGLTNMRRCVDRMELESEAGKGTKLTLEILLSADERFKEDKDQDIPPDL